MQEFQAFKQKISESFVSLGTTVTCRFLMYKPTSHLHKVVPVGLCTALGMEGKKLKSWAKSNVRKKTKSLVEYTEK